MNNWNVSKLIRKFFFKKNKKILIFLFKIYRSEIFLIIGWKRIDQWIENSIEEYTVALDDWE